MSRGMPSMTALLGMLALAGYQNRDKILEMFNNATNSLSKPLEEREAEARLAAA